MGLKLLLVAALALLLAIPALFVFALLMDRTSRAEQVTGEIGQLVGGPQTFLGPVLSIPYTAVIPAPPPTPGTTAVGPSVLRGTYVVFPDVAEARVRTVSEVRRRSLFEVPVYDADLAFTSRFDLRGTPEALPDGAVLDWARAEFLIGASDARGAKADVVLNAAGRALSLAPASSIAEQGLQGGVQSRTSIEPGQLRFFGAAAAAVAQPGAVFTAASTLKFSGAERIALLPFGRTTTVTIAGEWPHPSFDGAFLPAQRRVGADGYSARWNIPFIARGVPAEGAADLISRLGQTSVGVSFVEPANPYQSVARSLKYALLFVGLVFLTFFLF